MSALLVSVLSLAVFSLAYKFYGGFISKKVYILSDKGVTPAHKRQDGIDYVPTRPGILFSHHFVTIAGLGPILGPAIAVIWGWVPALLWILFGTVFIGAVHDFSALVISIRHNGRSIGDIAKDIIGGRARVLFLLIVFFALSLAMGVFTIVISTLFSPDYYPEVVIPSGSLIFIAMLIGYLVYKKNMRILPATVLGIILMVIAVSAGINMPVTGISKNLWMCILLLYAFFASSLPVWLLLQPRDYLNSFQLYLVLGLMYAGIFILHPVIAAPAVNHMSGSLPPVFPFLFIVVACGAVSGFHSLVSSGTTARQLDKESHARPVAYGGMLLEGVLAVAAVMACTAGFKTQAAWHAHYSGWNSAGGLGPKLDAFITGAGNFIGGLGVPSAYARPIVAVIVVGFALTTLDSATRLLRYNIEDIGRSLGAGFLKNRFTASLCAVLSIGFFAFMKAGTVLWQLFGTTNQLLAGLCLMIAALYLYRRGRPVIYVLVPMVFMVVVTGWGMIIKLFQFRQGGRWTLPAVGALVFLFAVWLAAEGINAAGKKNGNGKRDN